MRVAMTTVGAFNGLEFDFVALEMFLFLPSFRNFPAKLFFFRLHFLFDKFFENGGSEPHFMVDFKCNRTDLCLISLVECMLPSVIDIK